MKLFILLLLISTLGTLAFADGLCCGRNECPESVTAETERETADTAGTLVED